MVSAALRAIYLPQSDQPVRKLAYCPQVRVLFVKYIIADQLVDWFDEKSTTQAFTSCYFPILHIN